jgi:membrane associated rhomboid family serine protease
MGIYDREYYRGSGSRLLDPWSTTGEVCKWLIGINVGVFLLQMLTFPRGMPGGMGPATMGPVTDFLILDTNLVFSGQIWRLLTYAFLHSPGDIWHILFNMLFLWWFGSEIEGMYGPREFLTFYLVSALLGGIGFTGYYGLGDLAAGQMGPPHWCLGASGAVTAVLVLYACHFPFRTILLFFFLPVPIWLFVAFQVFQDAVVFASGRDNGIAVAVHLAGALFAFLYYRFHWRLSPLWSNFRFSLRRRARPRLRVYHEESIKAGPPPLPRSSVDEQLEAKLDAVLEKIKTSGKESLSESERQLLLRASEIYRKRREEV